MPPLSYMQALMSEPATIEQMETFEKQTFRNRCLLKVQSDKVQSTKDNLIRLTVPVKKVEHKQLTRDIEISYQTRWQHQHWITLVSTYQHTPYFMYFADYLKPFYEREYRWLIDLNDELNATIASLLRRQRPQKVESQQSKVESRTQDWSGLTWTDKHPWQTEESVLCTLFDEFEDSKI
ncbi:MAG: WbqC family protein [Paludibacteraceae bacterium]|nr:WbqC family protein [Paludibacteraceae bacterium]